jgi:hypothetical protein
MDSSVRFRGAESTGNVPIRHRAAAEGQTELRFDSRPNANANVRARSLRTHREGNDLVESGIVEPLPCDRLCENLGGDWSWIARHELRDHVVKIRDSARPHRCIFDQSKNLARDRLGAACVRHEFRNDATASDDVWQ